MKNNLLLILSILVTSISFGQVSSDEVIEQPLLDSVSYQNSDFDNEEVANYIRDKKLKVRVEMGTVFGSGNYFGTYVSPHLSYRINPRLTINTGFSLRQNFGGMYYEPYSGNQYSMGNFTSTLLYVEGAYQVTKNLIVTGTLFKEVNTFNQPSPNQPGFNQDFEGVIMGVDYKIGDHIFIHGEVEFSNGRNPYHNPYRNNMNGFHSSPFNSMNDPF